MRIFTMFIFALLTNVAFAQGVVEREHPRVSELQDKLTEYARGYLQTRLQGVPFMVTVKIEALRRASGSNYRPQQEKLPYYDLSEEEIRDEWDDPSASLYVLQSRIQKAIVMISLPKALKEEEVQEIKDTLTNLLRLIPGRDEIKIEQRNWSLGESFWYYSGLVFGAVFLMLMGFVFISQSWTRRLSNAIMAIKPKERAEGDAGVVNPGASLNTSGPNGNASNASGDLKFRDPLKTREFVSGRVQELLKNPAFPNLQAMIEMDKLAERMPKGLGALLMEFPLSKQKEIFSFSYKTSWLSALTEPGELTNESIELVDSLCRLQYDAASTDWQNLIIQVWRMGNDQSRVLKALSKEEAFSILKAMPSSAAVPAARLAFPGAWAVLLDPNFEPKSIGTSRVKEIYQSLVKEKPLNDFLALERFRQEKDLLAYLHIASVPEERDVYGALPKNSYLWQVRPPFYQILELKEEQLKKVFERVTLDDWALALFNVSRDYRVQIENLFNSKQKFLFTNKMRAIEAAGFDRGVLGHARERIARIYFNLVAEEAHLKIVKAEDSKATASSKRDKNAA